MLINRAFQWRQVQNKAEYYENDVFKVDYPITFPNTRYIQLANSFEWYSPNFYNTVSIIHRDGQNIEYSPYQRYQFWYVYSRHADSYDGPNTANIFFLSIGI